MATLFPRSFTQVIASNGFKAPGAKVYFFVAGTTTPLTVYSDYGLTTPLAHPTIADANGLVPTIYVPYGDYRVRVETSGGVVLSDADFISNPAPSSGGGGGGGDPVPEEQLLQTGDVIWSPIDALRTGFVRLNGRTIGNAVSGATERANPDTEDLYTFLYNNIADTYCPVSGSRGANAAADFAANKTITLLTGRGRSLMGLDTMGNNAANVAQVTTNLTTTASSSSASVASATDIAIGMIITNENVAAGTTITGISGTTITMSATASNSGTATGRFSAFRDAQAPGATGGSQIHTLVQRELSSNLGTASTTIINGSTVFRGGLNTAQVGSGSNAPTIISDVTATTTITNPLGDHPHPNMSPGLLGTFYMKL